jgi:flavin-dependent thymidylate synthase
MNYERKKRLNLLDEDYRDRIKEQHKSAKFLKAVDGIDVQIIDSPKLEFGTIASQMVMETWDRFNDVCKTKQVDDLFRAVVLEGACPTALEAAHFTWYITGVSLTATHQIVRHRLFGFSQRSSRAMDVRDYPYRIPSTITSEKSSPSDWEEEFMRITDAAHLLYERMVNSGVPFQDARYILPQALTTSIYVTGHYRALQDFYAQRICKIAQWEVRIIAEKLKEEMKKHHRLFAEGLRKPCDLSGKCSYTGHMMPPCKEENSEKYMYTKEQMEGR